MKKILSWLVDNLLFVETLFLLAFIPLYPKLPLVDIKNTWVYVRLDDFVVVAVILSWVLLLLKQKISLKTPLTIPILVFWLIGAITTIHGVVLIFPTLANVFPNVAFLAYLRHIEYMSLFFIAYSSIRDKKSVPIIAAVIVLTLLAVIGYGAGQKYLGFPAYLTMNEQYAKGTPIELSDLSRIPSTFAGHYDLAAYLVLLLPLVMSLIFGFKNWFAKFILGVAFILGFILLFNTVSRISFVALLIVIFVVLFFQKRRFVFYSIPVIILAGILLIGYKPTLLNRFNSTVKTVNVLVDGKTGDAVGEVKFVPSSYFKDKIIRQKFINHKDELDAAMTGDIDSPGSSPSSKLSPGEIIPPEVPLVIASNVSNGENLPQGTGYINLSLSPVVRRLGNFFYELAPDLRATTSAEVLIFHGSFLVKQAAAYDLSFTTRFQGEWPHAIEAFERDILFGSGYGSISLAIDNNYFRMLGETGLLGTVAFVLILIGIGIYITKTFSKIESKLVKSFVIGFAAGVIGLAINATLIDVFEASKVAYVLWLLVGITIGILSQYHDKEIDMVDSLKSTLVSSYAIIAYLLSAVILIYSPMISNFFVGDDFTWFRWAAECKTGVTNCPALPTILNYFTDAAGFFYRPGTKTYFYLMYHAFWLNQTVYHIVSLALHFGVAVLFFLLAQKVLKNKFQAAFSAILFLVMSGYSEAVFWTAATGDLFNAFFALSAVLLFVLWEDNKKNVYYVLSIICIFLGTLFHELGVVVPLLLILYKLVFREGKLKNILKDAHYPLLFSPLAIYLPLRFMAGSHWQGGDYTYNLLKLPFNVAGNVLGYIGLILLGPISLSGYEKLRSILASHIFVSSIFVLILVGVLYFTYKNFITKIDKHDLRITSFCVGFFVICLLPFLGLGNIATRYSYLASIGIIMLLVFILQKIYIALLSNGKTIAFTSVSVVVAVFCLFHIIQLQQIHGDWRTAGGTSQNFFVSVDGLYGDEWGKDPIELHFVNVPIKTGEAWIFPVGLPDALWFTFSNDNLKVFQDSDASVALQETEGNPLAHVFQFNDDGTLSQVVRTRNGPILIPTNN